MHLIIAEKNIVAERIAAFLGRQSEGSVTHGADAVHYVFDDTVVMGLRVSRSWKATTSGHFKPPPRRR